MRRPAAARTLRRMLPFLFALFAVSFNHQWIYRPDLSYVPPSADVSSGRFAKVDLFFFNRGTEAQAEELAKQHAQIDRDSGVTHAHEIYVAADGPDRPVIMQIVRANSEADFEAQRKASEALRGDRIRPVYAAVSKILRRMISVDQFMLPGAKGLVTLDYLAFDHANDRLWVPAGNTGRVDVIDSAGVHEIGGFATRAFELKGRRGFLGPSSVSIGEGQVYVGDRADASVCAIDARTLRRKRCVRIAGAADGWAAAPDAVVFVRPEHEVWVTRGAPPLGIASADRAITILDAETLRTKAKLPLNASAEGYAVDDERGIFYTNLEESAETIAIDIRSRAVVSRWHSGCDEPRGIAIDGRRQIVFVACSNRVVALRDGKVLDSLPAGDGLDNIDFFDGHVYAAAAVASTLTVADFGDDDRFHHVVSAPTMEGARVVVAGSGGAAWVADPAGGRMLRYSSSFSPVAGGSGGGVKRFTRRSSANSAG